MIGKTAQHNETKSQHISPTVEAWSETGLSTEPAEPQEKVLQSFP